MAETPWLTIVGLGEDGPAGLPTASREALAHAELVTGAARHLALLPEIRCAVMEWPVPFADGLPRLLAYRGRRVVMLASGDPFWFGAGSSVVRQLERGEWTALPGQSTFSLAAARLGWALEDTVCRGLHAAPLTRLRPDLAPGARVLVLLRDGAKVGELAEYLVGLSFGDSRLHVLEALGGPRERVRAVQAGRFDLSDIAHPVAVGVEVAGSGTTLQRVPGLPDDLFDHDGQITKRAVRALTLAALAPRRGELLWDIGAGSGSIGIEWLLAHPSTQAIGFEADPSRAIRARANAMALGVDRLQMVEGRAPLALRSQTPPDAVFIGGGLTEGLLDHLWQILRRGVRVVANAVTLESEALLNRWHREHGGHLTRVELSEAVPLGRKHGWRAAYPIVQWSGTR